MAEPQPPQCSSSAQVKELHHELHLPCATPTVRAAASHERNAMEDGDEGDGDEEDGAEEDRRLGSFGGRSPFVLHKSSKHAMGGI